MLFDNIYRFSLIGECFLYSIHSFTFWEPQSQLQRAFLLLLLRFNSIFSYPSRITLQISPKTFQFPVSLPFSSSNMLTGPPIFPFLFLVEFLPFVYLSTRLKSKLPSGSVVLVDEKIHE